MEKTLARLKAIISQEVIRAGYEIRRLILFGSRAGGEVRPTSDWDLYVIIAPTLSVKTRWEIADQISERLAEEGIWADVFVQSEEIAVQRADNTGYLTYYVLKEGVEL